MVQTQNDAVSISCKRATAIPPFLRHFDIMPASASSIFSSAPIFFTLAICKPDISRKDSLLARTHRMSSRRKSGMGQAAEVHLVPSKDMAPLPQNFGPVFFQNQFRTKIELPTKEKYPNVKGESAIVTGSNTGLGSSQRGSSCLLVSRIS